MVDTPKLARRRTTVEVEYTPPKLIHIVEQFLKAIAESEDDNDFGEIHVEVARGRVKRFKLTRNYMLDAL